MRNFFTIWQREMAACFLSPVAYVTLVIFLAVTGGTFMNGVMRNVGNNVSLISLVLATVVMWGSALITVICMRLFAEEKRSRTLEILMTAPVTETQVVLGKYAGALSFLWIAFAPALANIYVLASISPAIDVTSVDPGAIATGILILALVTAFCTAVGLLVSLLTENQIVAAICCFSFVWLVMLTGSMIHYVPGPMQAIADYVSVFGHVDDFAGGSLDTRPIVLYVSGTVVVLFAAVRILESRRWK